MKRNLLVGGNDTKTGALDLFPYLLACWGKFRLWLLNRSIQFEGKRQTVFVEVNENQLTQN